MIGELTWNINDTVRHGFLQPNFCYKAMIDVFANNKFGYFIDCGNKGQDVF